MLLTLVLRLIFYFSVNNSVGRKSGSTWVCLFFARWIWINFLKYLVCFVILQKFYLVLQNFCHNISGNLDF